MEMALRFLEARLGPSPFAAAKAACEGDGSPLMTAKAETARPVAAANGDATPGPETVFDAREAALDGDDALADLLAQHHDTELRLMVPLLLERMNHSSSEINGLDRRVCDARARHQHHLKQLSRLYETMRSLYGLQIVDRAKPYFDAAQAHAAASHAVQSAVEAFSAASALHARAKADVRTFEDHLEGSGSAPLDQGQQDGLANATVLVLQRHWERDDLESLYVAALKEYEEAGQLLEARRAAVGEHAIRRVQPCFHRLQEHQAELLAEQVRIGELEEQARASKRQHDSSLRELELVYAALSRAEAAHGRRGKPACPTEAPSPPAPTAADTSAGSASEATPPSTSISAAVFFDDFSRRRPSFDDCREAPPEVSPESEPSNALSPFD